MPRIKPAHLLRYLVACVLMTGGLSEAGAAVSGPAVLEAMLKQMGAAKTLTVRQRVESVLPDPASTAPIADALPAPLFGTPTLTPDAGRPAEVLARAPEMPAVVTEALTYQLPGGFRAEIRSETIQRVYLEVGGERLLSVDGRLASPGDGWFEAFKDLLVFNRRLPLHRHLALQGVDLAMASLGLWETRPVYVLGARFPDAAPGQIWVDKQTLLPLRWLRGSGGEAAGGQRHLEIRYDRWQRFGKRQYPLRVQFFEDHQLVRTLIAEAVTVDPEVDPGLMDMDLLRQSSLPAEADPPLADGEGDAAVDEIQEAIDIFKQRYE